MAGTSNAMLLALKGHITIVFMDQEVIEGEYITQDIYNIFITVDNQPMMVPRSQIRYIKGTTIGQIEVDTSQDSISEGADVSTQMPMTPLIDDDDDSTDKIAAFEQAPIPVEEDDDDTATFELPESPIPAFDDEDDGTVVLPPDSNQFEEDDDDDLTFVLPPTAEEADEDDATFVLSPDSFDEEDETVRLTGEQSAPTATLVCTSGPHSGQVFQLDSDSISIGRSSDNNVALSGDKEISRRHSIITLEAGSYVIKDQGSLNGTFVNNEAVTETHNLQNGDEILVGISTLKYEEM